MAFGPALPARRHRVALLPAALLLGGILTHSALRAEGRTLRLRPGQTSSAPVPTNLLDVKVRSADPGIARVRFARDQVTVTGVRPGTTRFRVTAQRVRYLVGFNAGGGKVSPHRAKSPDLAEYYDVDELYTVIIAGQGGAAAEPPSTFDNPSGSDYLVVRVGKSISATLPAHTGGVSVSSQDPAVASVRYGSDRVTISGVSAGRTLVTVSGESLRILLGSSPDLAEPHRFRQEFVVESTDSPEKKPARPRRVGSPPKEDPVLEVCQFNRRGISLPTGMNPVEARAQGDGAPFLRIQVVPPASASAQPRLSVSTTAAYVRPEGLLVPVRVRERRPRVNQPLYDETLKLRIVPCTLEGEWLGGGGFRVTQAGSKVKATFADGRVFTGTFRGRAARLEHTYRTVSAMPGRWADEVKRAMLGKTERLEGALEDGDRSLRMKLRHYRWDPEDPELKLEPAVGEVTYRRKAPHSRP